MVFAQLNLGEFCSKYFSFLHIMYFWFFLSIFVDFFLLLFDRTSFHVMWAWSSTIFKSWWCLVSWFSFLGFSVNLQWHKNLRRLLYNQLQVVRWNILIQILKCRTATYFSLPRLVVGGQHPVPGSNLRSRDSPSLVSIGYASFWRALDQRLLITDSSHTQGWGSLAELNFSNSKHQFLRFLVFWFSICYKKNIANFD